jgi:hypothetical protein
MSIAIVFELVNNWGWGIIPFQPYRKMKVLTALHLQ